MRTTRMTVLVLAGVLAIIGGPLTGCRKEGPAERAGEKVDDAVNKLEDAVDPKGPAEKAGEKIDKALEE